MQSHSSHNHSLFIAVYSYFVLFHFLVLVLFLYFYLLCECCLLFKNSQKLHFPWSFILSAHFSVRGHFMNLFSYSLYPYILLVLAAFFFFDMLFLSRPCVAHRFYRSFIVLLDSVNNLFCTEDFGEFCVHYLALSFCWTFYCWLLCLHHLNLSNL